MKDSVVLGPPSSGTLKRMTRKSLRPLALLGSRCLFESFMIYKLWLRCIQSPTYWPNSISKVLRTWRFSNCTWAWYKGKQNFVESRNWKTRLSSLFAIIFRWTLRNPTSTWIFCQTRSVKVSVWERFRAPRTVSSPDMILGSNNFIVIKRSTSEFDR